MVKNKFLAGLLAVLGFSACSPWSDKDDDGRSIELYGVPTASFVVKGAVMDTADKPIEGIRVVLRPASEDMYPYFRNDTVYTAPDGTFVTQRRPVDIYGGFTATAVDVDGEKNGGPFKPDERTFGFTPQSGDYRWEDGAYLKEVRFVLEEDKK